MQPALCGIRLMQERLATSSLRVFTVPCLADNYAWILQDVPTGQLAVVDTPSAKPIIDKLRELGIPQGTSPIILNTHHHRDHTGGNMQLKQEVNATVVGPKNDHIIGIDRGVVEGDQVEIGSSKCRVIDIPGHTKGHIGFVFDTPGIVFVGDTMFSHGCGALFEGSYSQMWKSLTKIMQLPPHYLVFCAHEYTGANVKYGLHIFPDDADLLQVYKQITQMRARGEQTVPSLLEQELKTNPFLRCRIPGYQSKLRAENALEAFKKVREGKDVWGRGSLRE
jgi:hydroxyacylglutathione hydrolase